MPEQPLAIEEMQSVLSEQRALLRMLRSLLEELLYLVAVQSETAPHAFMTDLQHHLMLGDVEAARRNPDRAKDSPRTREAVGKVAGEILERLARRLGVT